MTNETMTNRPFTVLIEGNIGVGKTTLLNYFAPFADIYTEPIDLWQNVNGCNLFQLLNENPQQWGSLFQSYVMLTAVQNHLHYSFKPVKMIERSIFSSHYCFTQLLHQSGILHEAEHDVLSKWLTFLTTTPHLDLKVDLIVYLRIEPEKAFERMKSRGRDEESHLSLSYLQKLHECYENWLIHHMFPVPAPVLIVDANPDLPDMKKTYDNFKKLMMDVKS
jgi:deoxynucleoside kinase